MFWMIGSLDIFFVWSPSYHLAAISISLYENCRNDSSFWCFQVDLQEFVYPFLIVFAHFEEQLVHHRLCLLVLFSRFQPRFVINPGDENSVVTRWEMRSIPAKGKASKWQVPVMNYQELDINGVKAIRDPVNELEFLMQLVESGKLFNYQESGIVYSVHATGFEWKPESLTSSGTGWQGTYTLVVEEIV